MATVDRSLPKVLKKREGAHENYVSAFGKSEHLRGLIRFKLAYVEQPDVAVIKEQSAPSNSASRQLPTIRRGWLFAGGDMGDDYQSITESTIAAIEAMASEPRETMICDAGSLLSLAASLYWSWSSMVGEDAQQVDCDRMIMAIAELQEKRRERALQYLVFR
jgi:hypothetical protein